MRVSLRKADFIDPNKKARVRTRRSGFVTGAVVALSLVAALSLAWKTLSDQMTTAKNVRNETANAFAKEGAVPLYFKAQEGNDLLVLPASENGGERICPVRDGKDGLVLRSGEVMTYRTEGEEGAWVVLGDLKKPASVSLTLETGSDESGDRTKIGIPLSEGDKYKFMQLLETNCRALVEAAVFERPLFDPMKVTRMVQGRSPN